MDSKERTLRTIAREPVDRPATWMGDPTPPALAGMLSHFGLPDEPALRAWLNDDIHSFNIPYESPTGNHIAAAFDFADAGGGPTGYSAEERTLTATGFFDGINDPAVVDDFPWPDPALYIDRDALLARVRSIPSDRASLALLWSAHFQDSLAAFGMESAMAAMILTPEMYRAVIDRITAFYVRANEIVYETTKGYLDIALIGNDFGSQRGLMVAPAQLREFVFSGTRQLVEQAHAYGVRVVHHSCGSIYEIIPDLIELGADAIHPIQALAANMDAERLAREFGGKVSFVGGVDVQELMVHGTADDVAQRIRELVGLLPTGLVISPSHEALLPDVPPENVRAMFEAAHKEYV
jgi:uroporphyrinogen decarboxylase